MAYDMKRVAQDKVANGDGAEWIKQAEAANPALARINAECLDKPRGFSVPKSRLLELIGDADERNIGKTIKQWRMCVFLKHGIFAEWSHAIRGYVFPMSVTELHEGHDKRQAAVQRKLKREALRLAMIAEDDIDNDHDRYRRRQLVDATNAVAGKLESQRALAEMWSKRPETMPRRQTE